MTSEKDKMLSGELYKAFGDELTEERLKARILVHEFNALEPDKLNRQRELIKELLGTTGERFHFEAPFRCDYGYNIHIGENFYSNFNLVILDCAPVHIGKNVLIGPDVGIYTAGHPLHHELRKQDFEFALAVTIGNNVWVGGQVVINPGVTIGDNVVIGSGSVVTKDVPPNMLAAGNPCKILREITEITGHEKGGD